MVRPQQIRELVDKIVRQFHPEPVILFGSYAYGKPTEDSDVDILVVMPLNGKRAAAQAAEIRGAVHGGFGLDLLVTPGERLRRRIADGDLLLKDIVDKGKTLYESSSSGLG